MVKLNISKKLAAVTLGAFIIGVASGSGVMYLTQEPSTPEGLELRTAGPGASDFKNTPTPSGSEDLPEGTVSPHSVAIEPHKYTGKEIKIRGIVAESAKDQFTITSQKSGEPLGVRLDISKVKTNRDEYVNKLLNESNLADPSKLLGPVTATGTLDVQNSDKGSTYILNVQSIEK